MNPLISVVVCTYNRANILGLCLQSLAEQTVDKSLYEVIVIDNNSTDSTANVVEGFLHAHSNYRSARETAQGIAHARNRGWQIAQGHYVGYIDDDCRATEDWLQIARATIEEFQPVQIGGVALAYYLYPKPAWFQDRYATFLLEGEQTRLTTAHEYFPTMNVFFRRTMFEQIGGFRTDLGMVGKTIAYGEDTEIMIRMRAMLPHEKIYYVPALRIYHLTRPEKFSWQWNIRRSFADGRYSFRLFGSNYIASLPFEKVMLEFWREVLRLFYDMCLRVWRRDRVRHPFWQNYFYEIILPRVSRLGTLYEHLTGAK